MTTQTEALKLALEALYFLPALSPEQNESQDEAIEAIKEALAQPEQEPVAVLFEDGSIVKYENLEFVPEKSGQRVQMLYTTPPQRTWVGLTDEEAVEVMRKVPHLTIGGLLSVEAKLKEKNCLQ